MVTLTIGQSIGRPGDIIRVPISLDTALTPVRSLQVNLDYNAAQIGSVNVCRGPALPVAWSFSANTPILGDTRFLAFEFGTGAVPIVGAIADVDFSILPIASSESIAIQVAQEDVRDAANLKLSVTSIGGEVIIVVVLSGGQLVELRRALARRGTVNYNKAEINAMLQAIEDGNQANNTTIDAGIDAATTPFVFNRAQKDFAIAQYYDQRAVREGALGRVAGEGSLGR